LFKAGAINLRIGISTLSMVKLFDEINDFGPNLSFFFSNGVDPEYAVIDV
jgi:methylmalonyl-CoA mutase N-terminal domain/subunit